jgi:hypothetical protein
LVLRGGVLVAFSTILVVLVAVILDIALITIAIVLTTVGVCASGIDTSVNILLGRASNTSARFINEWQGSTSDGMSVNVFRILLGALTSCHQNRVVT